jgi:hypothetical protein
MITAKCGCNFTVDDDCVCMEMEPNVWEVIAVIPELEPPETPTGWANENVIWPHETECMEAQQWFMNDGLRIVYRLIDEAIFKQKFLDGLILTRIVN